MDTRVSPNLHSHYGALFGVIAASVALRLASALYQGNDVTALPGIYDQISYDALARRVLGGYGFSFATDWWPATAAGAPTAHWSFLYTSFLAGVYSLCGASPLVARVIQAIVAGIFQPWLTWRIGARLFGQRAGLLGAAVSAIYVYFFYYAGALMTETFFLLCILWVLDLSTGLAAGNGPARRSGGGYRQSATDARPWLLLGLALGAAALLRQVILLALPVLVLWLLWAHGRGDSGTIAASARARIRPVATGLAISGVVLIAMILPWTARNYAAFGRFVLLNTNSGFAFFWANHPIHGTNFISVLPDGTYQELIPRELRGLNEAALDQALLKKGLGFVIEDPGRYLLLSVNRAKDYFPFWPAPNSGPGSNLGRMLSFGLFLPFMLWGLAITARRWRSASADQQSGIALLLLFTASYSLTHLLSWALPRYRLPVDAVLVLFAGTALAEMAALIGRRRAAASRGRLALENGTHQPAQLFTASGVAKSTSGNQPSASGSK